MASICLECKEPLPPREPGRPGPNRRLYCSTLHKDRAKNRRYRQQATQFRRLRAQLTEMEAK